MGACLCPIWDPCCSLAIGSLCGAQLVSEPALDMTPQRSGSVVASEAAYSGLPSGVPSGAAWWRAASGGLPGSTWRSRAQAGVPGSRRWAREPRGGASQAAPGEMNIAAAWKALLRSSAVAFRAGVRIGDRWD